MSHFEHILKELSPLLKTHLHVDQHGICQLKINQHIHIQLSLSKTHEELMIASLIGEVAPGKFRENIFKMALKANYPAPPDGILSFCELKNELALFAYVPLHELSGHSLMAFLKQFLSKIEYWKQILGTS